MDKNGIAKIIDFGCSKDLKIHFVTREYPPDTYEYYPPEIIDQKTYCLKKNAPFDYRVDFWAFGICIYRLLTGCYPFKNHKSIIQDEMPDPNQTRKVKSDRYKINKWTHDFVFRLLKKDPDERLGYLYLFENLKNHQFFKDISWEGIENLKIKPPIKPRNFFRINSHSFYRLMHKEIGT